VSATVADIVSRPLTSARGTFAKGLAPAKSAEALRVDRQGGDHGAGIIRGFAVCTVGEALGHQHWCDGEFLSQLQNVGNGKANGLKARFTHPGLSADGLGRFLGRAKSFSLDGETLRADLHFDPTSHETPDGDLGKYAMDLAESDPEAFGSSIVFTHDYEAEDQFKLKHGGEWKEVDDGYETFRVIVGFESPDPRNVNHYPHCRLAELRAVDTVDEPAANPDGLFHLPNETLSQAQSFMAYALGLSDETPQGELAAQINPERARGFAARFLSEKGLTIGPKELFMSKGSESPPAKTPESTGATALSEADIRQQVRAEAQKYTAKFGAQGAQWFAEGVSWEDAHDKFAAAQADKITALTKERDDAVSQLAALDRGEKTPVETGSQDGGSSYAAIIKAKNDKK